MSGFGDHPFLQQKHTKHLPPITETKRMMQGPCTLQLLTGDTSRGTYEQFLPIFFERIHYPIGNPRLPYNRNSQL
jgi:hypothetical protein